MTNIKQRILEYIKEYKMSTEEVSDAMGKVGVIRNIKPIAMGKYAVGEIEYIYTFDNSNWPIHEQIRDLDGGKIVFIDAINVSEMALFGQLVTRFMIQKKNAIAVVANGEVRDLQGLIEDQANVWCKGITPIGCYNVKVEASEETLKTVDKNKKFYEGSIAVCDDSGVVIISDEWITEEFLKKLENMRKQEKIWFDCVMNKNWDTYDTVCLKRYLEE